jgi:flagellar biosynthesis protein FlhA
LSIGGGCTALAFVLARRERDLEKQSRQQAAATARPCPEERVEDYLAVDPMELELGVGLIRLADAQRGGDLLARVAGVRKEIAGDLGLLVPKVRIRDNMRLDQNQYRIKISDVPVAEGQIFPTRLLAIAGSGGPGQLTGHAADARALGRPAVWIEPHRRGEAQRAGYTVVEPAGAIAVHLTEVVRAHAHELLSRDATRQLIDEVKKSSPAVVEELIPGQMKLVEVQQVLQLLLQEGVSIRQLAPILDALGEAAPHTRDPVELAELVRGRLARAITVRYRDADGRILVVTLDPHLEDRIAAGVERADRGWKLGFAPGDVDEICRRVGVAVEPLARENRPPIVLVGPQIRPAVRQVVAARLPRVVVLSFHEIASDARVESVALVEDI